MAAEGEPTFSEYGYTLHYSNQLHKFISYHLYTGCWRYRGEQIVLLILIFFEGKKEKAKI